MRLSPTAIFYMAVGLLSVTAIVASNVRLFRFGGAAGRCSWLEGIYYLIAVAALLIGWYFNLEYMHTYGSDAGWLHWTSLLFVNPASASGGQDLIIANMLLFPLWTVVDGRRCGLRVSWLYFPMSLLTSYAFGVAVYLAMRERQLRFASSATAH